MKAFRDQIKDFKMDRQRVKDNRELARVGYEKDKQKKDI